MSFISPITCDQFMFAANNEVMVRQSNLIFYMHRQRNLFLCCCDANWYFSFLIHWMKINFCWSQNCITFLQGFNAGSCKLCRDMRWNFGILGFIKFEICCVYVSLSIQCLKISWRQLEKKRMHASDSSLRNSVLLAFVNWLIVWTVVFTSLHLL